LEPLRRMVDDDGFWQHQSDGLVIYVSPGHFRSFRVALSLEDEATVGPRYRIRPLLPVVSGNGNFLILALAENSVRLFEASRFSIGELDLGAVPGSKADALWYEDPERQLQLRQVGGGSAVFHGHGLGDEVRKEELERFLRAVDKGLHERLGNTDRPLMLACVAYYAATFRSLTSYPKVVEEVIEGNPEHLRPHEIHAKAWPLIERLQDGKLRATIDSFNDLSDTPRSATDTAEIVVAAGSGRVGELLVGQAQPELWGSYDAPTAKVTISDERKPMDVDLVDLAAELTIANGGKVHSIPETLDTSVGLAAIYRY
jgi:hypothetical protein